MNNKVMFMMLDYGLNAKKEMIATNVNRAELVQPAHQVIVSVVFLQ